MTGATPISGGELRAPLFQPFHFHFASYGPVLLLCASGTTWTIALNYYILYISQELFAFTIGNRVNHRSIIYSNLSACVCVSVCLLPRNLGECFVSLLVELIAGKNVSPFNKQLWRFLTNVSVAEKS